MIPAAASVKKATPAGEGTGTLILRPTILPPPVTVSAMREPVSLPLNVASASGARMLTS